MERKIVFFVLLSFFVSMSLLAQTTGRIAGRVRDQDGNPVAYASVSIDGLGMGASTDDKGTYIIINIPPGRYDVLCQMMGYQSQRLPSIAVNVNEATVLNINLTRTAVQMDVFRVVETKEELVSATKTSSGRTVTSESIMDLTVTDISDIIAVQAGVSIVDGELHVRGGRSNEVQYTIDGMSVSDPVDGASSLSIDTDAIEVTNVMTGGFPAEYGNAQSGIINIVTKSGDEFYSGKLEFITDHIVTGNDSNSDEIKFAIGGPLLTPAFPNLQKKLTFFLNGGGKWYDTRYKGFYQSNPTEELKYLVSEEFPNYDPYENRESIAGFDIGDNRNFNDYQLNFKTKYQVNPFQNFTFALRADKSLYDPYFHTWKYALAHTPRVNAVQQQYIVTYDHTFNSKTNLKVKGSVFHKQYQESPKGVDRDNYFWVDGNWADYDGSYASKLQHITENPVLYLTENGVIGATKEIPWEFIDSAGNARAVTDFVRPGSIWGTYVDDENKIFNFRADLEYQLNLIHNFKTGLELIKHYIRKDQQFNPWVVDNFRYEKYLRDKATPIFSFAQDDVFYIIDPVTGAIADSIVFQADTDFYSAQDRFNATIVAAGEVDGYEANPWQAAYYIQDSMQWEGMNVNAGLRFDFWYLGKDYEKFQNDGTSEYVEFKKSDRFQMMLSPRLGISHPISETTVLHFAYNYQNQLPQMQYIFTSKSPLDAITSDQQIVIGNPSLEPQITVTYEVGLQKQLSEYYVLDIATYYKNIYNYVNTQKVYLQSDGSLIPFTEDPADKSTEMYRYISEDYGSAKGIDLNIQRLLANFISGSAAYSLGWAQGNNSNAVLQNEATSLREFTLDWDIRHTFNFNLTFRVGKQEDWYLPFTDVVFPMDDFSINFSYDVSSGKPYTPFSAANKPLETNSERLKYYEMASMRFSKRISFGTTTNMRLYMNIQNLFNRRNELFVYPRTGSPYYDGADLSAGGSSFVSEELQYIHDLRTNHPGNISNGRTYTFGLAFEW
jgi:outer membrane receptor protein involved in Fe transport